MNITDLLNTEDHSCPCTLRRITIYFLFRQFLNHYTVLIKFLQKCQFWTKPLKSLSKKNNIFLNQQITSHSNVGACHFEIQFEIFVKKQSSRKKCFLSVYANYFKCGTQIHVTASFANNKWSFNLCMTTILCKLRDLPPTLTHAENIISLGRYLCP